MSEHRSHKAPRTPPRAAVLPFADERMRQLVGAESAVAPCTLEPNSLTLWRLLAAATPFPRLQVDLADQYLALRQRQPNGSASGVRRAMLDKDEHARRLLNEAVARLNRELRDTPYAVQLGFVLTKRKDAK